MISKTSADPQVNLVNYLYLLSHTCILALMCDDIRRFYGFMV
jgi:hypothetical protein